MQNTSLLSDLIRAFKCLPSVGAKSAQRMAFHILEHDRQAGKVLATTLAKAIEKIGHCEQCRTLTEERLCRICSDLGRDERLLCVVEHPSDVIAVEKATNYRGNYFVLLGNLSPLDGIGPEDLGIVLLEKKLSSGALEEVILATNSTVEGEVTAHFISEIANQYSVKTTRIAHGVPIGGELDYVDTGTLSHAFDGRRHY